MAGSSRSIILRSLTATGIVVTTLADLPFEPGELAVGITPRIEDWDGEWSITDFDTDDPERAHPTTSRFAVWHPIAQAWWEITPHVASWLEGSSEMVYPNRQGVLIEIRLHNALGVQDLFNLQEASLLDTKYVMRKDDNVFQATVRIRIGFEGKNDSMIWIIDVIEREDRVINDMLVVQDGSANARPRRRLEAEDYKASNWIVETFVVPGKEPEKIDAEQVTLNGMMVKVDSVEVGHLATIGWSIGNNYYDLRSLEPIDEEV